MLTPFFANASIYLRKPQIQITKDCHKTAWNLSLRKPFLKKQFPQAPSEKLFSNIANVYSICDIHNKKIFEREFERKLFIKSFLSYRRSMATAIVFLKKILLS